LTSLLDLVTSVPARILRLKPTADYIAVRSDASEPIDALLHGTVALVVNRERIRLISPDLAKQLPPSARRKFHMLQVEGRPPVLVDADVRALRRVAAKYLGSDLHLAGKRVLV
jgi:hypothetical protein